MLFSFQHHLYLDSLHKILPGVFHLRLNSHVGIHANASRAPLLLLPFCQQLPLRGYFDSFRRLRESQDLFRVVSAAHALSRAVLSVLSEHLSGSIASSVSTVPASSITESCLGCCAAPALLDLPPLPIAYSLPQLVRNWRPTRTKSHPNQP